MSRDTAGIDRTGMTDAHAWRNVRAGTRFALKSHHRRGRELGTSRRMDDRRFAMANAVPSGGRIFGASLAEGDGFANCPCVEKKSARKLPRRPFLWTAGLGERTGQTFQKSFVVCTKSTYYAEHSINLDAAFGSPKLRCSSFEGTQHGGRRPVHSRRRYACRPQSA